MFLTKECDYGLRIIRALSSGERATAEEICAAETVPLQFAYKILRKLERAGWLMSSRGKDGGYWLVKSLDTMSIYDVVSAIDEKLFINECLRGDRPCVRNVANRPCVMHKELERVQETLIKELKRNKLSKILVIDEN